MENHVKYNEGIYYQSVDGGIYVNLFISSELNLMKSGVTITQQTKYPEEESTTIKIQNKNAQSLPIYVRKPWWSKSDFVFQVNGKEVKAPLQPNGYYAVNRVWKNGDVIKVSMPMHLYLEGMPDNRSRICFMYGPLVLASPLGQEEPESIFGAPALVTEYDNVTSLVKRAQSLTFNTSNTTAFGDFKLVPFYSIYNERYNVYWDVFSATDWEREKQRLEEEAKKAKEIERLTLDYLQPGDSASEKKHNLKSEKSFRGQSNQRKWRDAREGGFLSFDMKVDPSLPSTFMLTFWGSDGGGRLLFDILADGEKVTTQEVRQNFPNRFFDVRYKLEDRLTHGKESITITLKPQTDKRVARVFGARVIRE